MILADTSIWIEFLRRKSPTFEHLLFLLEQREVISVEAIFGELLQGAKSSHERHIILSYWENVKKCDPSEIWIKTGLKAGEEKWKDKGLSLVDGAILIAAAESESKIWTLDKNLSKLAQKKYDPQLD